MRLTRPLAVLASAIALAGWSATGVGTTTQSDIQPAPPPGTYCRADPAAGTITTAPVPDLRPFQDYRSGLGLDASLTGSGIRIADVEYEWTATHLDLAGQLLPVADPTGLNPTFMARDHGTAVLGILGATDDGQGITGVVPNATLLPFSPLFSPAALGEPLVYDPARAITDAAKGLGAGDVMLIELQWQVAAGIYAPIEYDPNVRMAIRAVVNAGIVVVEPAGNGGLDIGAVVPVRAWLSDPTHRLNSGALMVGGGGSGKGVVGVVDRERVPGSNYGARVDVQGFGEAVVTTGYADLTTPAAGADRAYTACFDGTSSAAATVAGAVAALQAKAKALYGVPLTPAQVRTLLVDTGLPQVPSVGDAAAPKKIGPRPQIAAAITKLTGAPYPPPPAPTAEPVVTPPATTAPSTIAIPAPFITGPPIRLTTRAAARGLSIRFDRSTGRATIRLRGVAPSATVRVGTRRVTVNRGRIVLTNVVPGRIVLRVTAAMRGSRIYRPVAFRITVPVDGAVRVARL